MKRLTQRDNDEEAQILKDGEVLRVPVMAMDAIQRAVAQYFGDATRLHDGMGNPAGYKPGCVFQGGAQQAADAAKAAGQRRAAAYDEYRQGLQNAWRGQPRDQQQTAPAERTYGDAGASAYEEYCHRLSNAWRNAR